ncbi:response regulator [Sphingobacterium oryzagri]|uniref:Response regulator n=1 Tax=Sphingobacterium oryzagri TaxID=3025669 RepID=A0ABY7WMR7_9SPHI|nr:response regulator [Sphingobacterium sp. KACC 22765]WDF70805.1 response regulator [Sphingobacterium sp. KACC 22765]
MESILVIEDDFMFCKLVSNYLNKNGYKAVEATDGHAAKEQLQQRSFDLVLVDYRLPDTNGIDLVKWIKTQQADTKIIMMSRTIDEELKNEAFALGVSAFLNKPLNPPELLKLVQQIT